MPTPELIAISRAPLESLPNRYRKLLLTGSNQDFEIHELPTAALVTLTDIE